jgi:MFS family permease
MILSPLIAPLARDLDLAEWQVGAVVSVTALVMVAASPVWGRYGRLWGRRRVLLITTISGTLAIATFALLTQFGLAGVIGPMGLFVGFLLVRGLWFGLSEAAVMPNVQAYIAETTPDPAGRVKGMAALGAANGAALIVGSALGGLLAIGGPLVPLWVTPAILAVAVLLVATRFRATSATGGAEETPARVRVLDTRVFPFLVLSFGTFTALGFLQILMGFIVQDRLGVGTERTALLTGIALVGVGIGLVLAQALIVPRSGWTPPTLIKVGLLIATVGFVCVLPSWGIAGILTGVLLTGLGIGMVAPGVNAGASLAVTDLEQGATAGLIAATNALTLVLAPLAATALYGIAPLVPLVISAIVCAISLLLALAALRPGGTGTRPPRSTR